MGEVNAEGTLGGANRDSGVNERAAVVQSLCRWADNGGVWRVVARSAAGVEISLLTCDGGQEMDRLISADPAVLDFIGVRSGSDEPQHLQGNTGFGKAGGFHSTAGRDAFFDGAGDVPDVDP